MSISVLLDYGLDRAGLPAAEDFERWAHSLDGLTTSSAEVAVRIVDQAEGIALNEKWRDKTGPTNVLSFPCDDPRGVEPKMLGDIAICAPLVFEEAKRDGKRPDAHWAHLLIHGLLHLLGYDHLDETEALEMENLERAALHALGIDDPYQSRP